MTIDVLGIGFDSISMDEAVSRGLELAEGRTSAIVVTPNAEIVSMCGTDPELKEIVNSAELVLPDGIGIIYGAKLLGRPLKEKVAGIDFGIGVMAELGKRGGSVYLLGAKPGVAELAAENLCERCPGLRIAGIHDGYFRDDAPVIEKINEVSPDLLLVCLGASAQEHWMGRNREKLNVGLMAGLGGSMDVYAGQVRRAPKGWQKLGLEWLYRLLTEPW